MTDQEPIQSDSSIQSLFSLTNDLVESHGQKAVDDALGEKTASKKGVEVEQNSGGFKLAGILIVGVLAGCVAGWLGRESYQPAPGPKSAYRPLTEAEAHQIFVRKGIDPKDKPKPVAAKQSPTPAKEVKKEGKSSSKTPRPPFDAGNRPSGGIGPLPVAVASPIDGALPPAGGFPASPPAQAKPSAADLHALEAKVRVQISDAGGRVTRTRESGSSKTLTVSIRESMAESLRSRIRHVAGDNAMVSGVSSDDSDSSVENDVIKSAELKAAQDTVTTLKAEVAKDEQSFIPTAPALKSVQAQYMEALKHYAELRRASHPDSTFQVVLTP